ncbi:hypothetical protein AB0436_15240 [Streptomyces sp. NPDC051322]|uniref:hypothetical protein n=1 Tax=Streptomyces sp. NPDC051322 TaxID=3154645 RepID=UPI00344C3208
MQSRSTVRRSVVLLTTLSCAAAVLLTGLVFGSARLLGTTHHDRRVPAARRLNSRTGTGARTSVRNAPTVHSVDFRWDDAPQDVRDRVCADNPEVMTGGLSLTDLPDGPPCR